MPRASESGKCSLKEGRRSSYFEVINNFGMYLLYYYCYYCYCYYYYYYYYYPNIILLSSSTHPPRTHISE
jgi:hypothetical protein